MWVHRRASVGLASISCNPALPAVQQDLWLPGSDAEHITCLLARESLDVVEQHDLALARWQLDPAPARSTGTHG